MHNRPESSEERGQIVLSIRVIPFSVGGKGLVVALDRSGNPSSSCALPFGQPGPDETLRDCADRIARETLTISPDYIEQLYTFHVSGDPPQVIVAYSAILSADTHAYVTLYEGVRFHDIETLQSLSVVDRGILDYAKTRLRAKLGYSNIGFHFLPREFTLSELQDVYESVIGESLDKRNFRRRVLAAGIVESVGAKRSTNHRPASLYRFTGGDPAFDALTPNDTEWSV